MNLQTVLHDINSYGYIIITLFLFLGIVGIPAPEESLLFLVGILASRHQLSLFYAVICAFAGAFLGMMTAYVLGRHIGLPLIERYGKFIGVTSERWLTVKSKYTENAYKTILFGFFMPGIRQISPYFAGMSHISLKNFSLFSFLGATIWNVLYILLGFYLGRMFHINPAYVAYLGIGLFMLFIFQLVIKTMKMRTSN